MKVQERPKTCVGIRASSKLHIFMNIVGAIAEIVHDMGFHIKIVQRTSGAGEKNPKPEDFNSKMQFAFIQSEPRGSCIHSLIHS